MSSGLAFSSAWPLLELQRAEKQIVVEVMQYILVSHHDLGLQHALAYVRDAMWGTPWQYVL